MLKNLMSLSFAFILMCILLTPTFAQEGSQQDANTTPAKTEKGSKGEAKKGAARWEGFVVGTSKDNSTLTVRGTAHGSSLQKVIHYGNSTQWESKEHGSKTIYKIDPSQVKEGDRVIVLGNEDKDGFHATVVSKRLSRY